MKTQQTISRSSAATYILNESSWPRGGMSIGLQSASILANLSTKNNSQWNPLHFWSRHFYSEGKNSWPEMANPSYLTLVWITEPRGLGVRLENQDPMNPSLTWLMMDGEISKVSSNPTTDSFSIPLSPWQKKIEDCQEQIPRTLVNLKNSLQACNLSVVLN